MPQLPVKSKEEKMDSTRLYDLEEAIQHLSDGLDAVGVMVMGQIQDTHAGGFYALWRYLDGARQEVRRQLDACMNAK
jgi:hypothetical protein